MDERGGGEVKWVEIFFFKQFFTSYIKQKTETKICMSVYRHVERFIYPKAAPLD